MIVVKSESMNVYENLAVEACLMDDESIPVPALFLWQSDCAVVIGKHQNPWRECRLDLMARDGVPLARRISGGGTVYHDAGNLNYCVIVDRAEYQELRAFEMVVYALGAFGIRGVRSGVSNLSVDGLKFSGNAFCFRKNRVMHHGTLLLNTDLTALNRYLGSVIDGIETHAIRSVPAEVTNLKLERKEVAAALEDSFSLHYNKGEIAAINRCRVGNLDKTRFRHFYDQQLSREWKLGATPKFTLSSVSGGIDVVKGNISALPPGADPGWAGRPFEEIVADQNFRIAAE